MKQGGLAGEGHVLSIHHWYDIMRRLSRIFRGGGVESGLRALQVCTHCTDRNILRWFIIDCLSVAPPSVGVERRTPKFLAITNSPDGRKRHFSSVLVLYVYPSRDPMSLPGADPGGGSCSPTTPPPPPTPIFRQSNKLKFWLESNTKNFSQVNAVDDSSPSE